MALIQKCIQEGAQVLAICHKGSLRNSMLPQSSLLTVQETDLRYLHQIDVTTEKKYNIFYHLAWTGTFGQARNDVRVQLCNIQYTLDAVELADRLGCKIFIGAGSQAEYGRVEGLLKSTTPTFPENAYGAAKLCAGELSRILCGQKEISHIWVRILSVYGPYDRHQTMVSSSLRKMLSQKAVKFTPAEQMWDFLYSGDAAEALWKIGQKGKAGKIYCLGSGEARPLREYIDIMRKLTRYQGDLGIGKLPYFPGQVMNLHADVTELTEDTGFYPQIDFCEGIRRTIEWIKKDEKDKYCDTML